MTLCAEHSLTPQYAIIESPQEAIRQHGRNVAKPAAIHWSRVAAWWYRRRSGKIRYRHCVRTPRRVGHKQENCIG